MADAFKFTALQKDGKVYVMKPSNYGYGSEWDTAQLNSYRFDGAMAILSYNRKFAIIPAAPAVVESLSRETKKIVGFKLKEGFIPSELLPAEVPANWFASSDEDEDDIRCSKKELYEPTVEVVPEFWRPIEFKFEIVDLDCAPRKNKYPFHAVFPYDANYHAESLHKFPCYITGLELFGIVRDRLKAGLPDHLYIDKAFDDLNLIDIGMKLPVVHAEKVKKQRGSGRSKRLYDEPLRVLERVVLKLSGGTYHQRGAGTLVVPKIEAQNSEELDQKVDEFIESIMWVKKHKLSVCPECKGHGYLDEAIEK